jgi:hypothetical protein
MVSLSVCLLIHLSGYISAFLPIYPSLCISVYEGKSVNRSQIDIKRKTCNIRTWVKTLIHLSDRFTSASKPSTYKSFDCCLSPILTSISTSSSAKRLPPSCELLCRTDTSHRKQETFPYKYPLHWVSLPAKKTHYKTLLFGSNSSILEHVRHFDYRNQSLNMLMRVCYLDYHEAGLPCYQVIQKPIRSINSCSTSIFDPFSDSLVSVLSIYHLSVYLYAVYLSVNPPVYKESGITC